MKRGFSIVFVGFAFLFFTISFASVGQNNSEIRICSLNLKNYNTAYRYVDGKTQLIPKVESERNGVCKILKDVNADVLVVQELGDEGFLNDLNKRLRKIGVVYPYSFISSKVTASRIAILSKLKPTEIFDFSNIAMLYNGEKSESSRGTLGIKLKVNGREFCVFGLHLKSKFGSNKEDRDFRVFRNTESIALCERIIQDLGFKAPMMLCGDFNEDVENSDLRRIFAKYSFILLPAYDSNGENHTYLWKKKKRFFRYDSFLINKALSKIVLKSSAVIHTCESDYTFSDHRAIFADFKISN